MEMQDVSGGYGNGVVRDGAMAGSEGLMAINTAPVVTYGNIGVDFM